MKFLKSGFIPFFAGVTIIISYFLVSPYKMTADSSPYPISIFNVLFTILFLVSCCVVAFQYGKRQNKSGLLGVIGIWVLFYISLLFAGIPGFIPIFIGYIMFSYWTLLFITNLFAMFSYPAIMIILAICSWFLGKNRTQRV
jgi:hypothetical protein